ncbi:hypothetical protein ACQP3D_29175, partial [Escherichia coli]
VVEQDSSSIGSQEAAETDAYVISNPQDRYPFPLVNAVWTVLPRYIPKWALLTSVYFSRSTLLLLNLEK